MKLVVLGLSLTSSWGNGHATTYRALLARLRRPRPRRHLPRARACPGTPARTATSPTPTSAASPSTPTSPSSRPGTREIASRRRGHRRLLRARRRRGRRAGCSERRTGRHRLLRHRHAGDAGQARRRRRGVPLARADPRLRPLPLLHRRPDPRPPRARLRRPRRAARSTARSTPTPTGRWQPPPRWDLSYLGTYSPDRQPTLERLLLEPARRAPDLRFVVAGPQYPADIDWPANVERIEHLPPAEHPAFYVGQPLHPQRHPRRHDRRRLQPERAAVRGRRLRHADRLRRLAGPRRRSSPRAEEILVADDRRRRPRAPSPSPTAPPPRSPPRRGRASSPTTPPRTARPSSRLISPRRARGRQGTIRAFMNPSGRSRVAASASSSRSSG